MKKSVSILLSSTIMASVPMGLVSHADSSVKQVISSANRYETSIEVSKKNFKSADYVILASGVSFPDALSGGVLAGYLKSPVLLVGPQGLTESLKSEIKRLSPKKIYILGGKKMISADIENSLNKNITTSRLSGTNRYETSLLIAQEMRKLGAGEKVAIANGENYPDALSASAAMAKEKTPLVLVDGKTISKINRKNIKYIFGGQLSIPENIAEATRISGKNRFETSVAVAKRFYSQPKNIIISSGENYPDALSSTSMAAISESPVLLTRRASVPPELKKYLAEVKPDITIIGGNLSVDKTIFEKAVPSEEIKHEDTHHSHSSYGTRSGSASLPSDKETTANKGELSKKISQLLSDLDSINDTEYKAESSKDSFETIKNNIKTKLETYKGELASDNITEEKITEIQNYLEGHHGPIGSVFILSPYKILNITNETTVAANAVKSKGKDGDAVGRFPRIKADTDNKYRFLISTNHKGYVLNSDSNKNEKKLLGFTYVTTDGYNKPTDKSNNDISNTKLYDSPNTLGKNQNVDVVTNPTPRYNRQSLTAKTEPNNSTITVTAVDNGYKVEIGNLPKDTLIVKPVFINKISDYTKLEYGDMIFIDQSK